jgi:hypothetical protein
MVEWRCLHFEDMAGEEAFWTMKKDERRERRMMRRKRFIEAKLAGPSTLNENDDRCDDLILTTEEISRAESSDDE